MIVWVLRDNWENTIEGVYTQEAKEKRENEFYEYALKNRNNQIARLNNTIEELKQIRKPFIDEAESLVTIEAEAKILDSGGKYREIRKHRKQLLRQAEKLTYDIKRHEENILASQRMTKSQIISTYGMSRYEFEDHFLEGV